MDAPFSFPEPFPALLPGTALLTLPCPWWCCRSPSLCFGEQKCGWEIGMGNRDATKQTSPSYPWPFHSVCCSCSIPLILFPFLSAILCLPGRLPGVVPSFNYSCTHSALGATGGKGSSLSNFHTPALPRLPGAPCTPEQAPASHGISIIIYA